MGLKGRNGHRYLMARCVVGDEGERGQSFGRFDQNTVIAVNNKKRRKAK